MPIGGGFFAKVKLLSVALKSPNRHRSGTFCEISNFLWISFVVRTHSNSIILKFSYLRIFRQLVTRACQKHYANSQLENADS